jgi:hypothetical protein
MKSGDEPRNLKWDKLSQKTCVQEVSFHSFDACPAFDSSFIWDFLYDYRFLWGIVFVIMGAFINFYGRKMIEPTTFFMTFVLITLLLLLVIYSMFLRHGTYKSWVGWLTLSICAVIGLVVGYFAVKFINYGVALVGGGVGACIALLICDIFEVKHTAIFWTILLISALISTFLSFK